MARTPAFKILQESLKRAYQKEHTRRDFLKKTAAVGVMLSPLSSLAACATRKPAATLSIEPVVILGAGAAGLTSAYELTKQGIPTVIYEARSRVGGRIFTKNDFNSEGMFCELGGELIDNQFADMLRICSELGVPIDDFRPANKGLEPMVFYFGGRAYYQRDLDRAIVPFMKHLLRDVKRAYGSVEGYEVGYKKHTPAAASLDGKPMAEYLYGMKDVEKWVLDFVEIAYRGEYGLDTGLQSTLNLLMLADRDLSNGFAIFGESDECLRIRGGNSRFIEALVNAISSKVPLHLEQRLVRIEDLGNQFRLTFQKDGGSTHTVTASQILCAMPFSVLRQVEGIQELRLSEVKKKAIAQLSYGTNAKCMLGMKNRAWRQGISGIKPTAAYTFTDLRSQVFWETSQMQSGNSGILTNFLGAQEGQMHEANRAQVALADLDRVYKGLSASFDGNVAQYRWITDPYSQGSYTCPTVGQWTSIIGAPQEPELNGRLLFAGEQCSEEFQGYMNGAVQSATQAAAQIAVARASHPERYSFILRKPHAPNLPVYQPTA